MTIATAETSSDRVGASFRDPNGFAFTRDGPVYRQVNRSYAPDFEHLTKSGLYDRLVEQRLLVTHETSDVPAAEPGDAYCVLKPSKIGFVTYPYEWSFSQLKDAALLTLRIQEEALAKGMSLKDSSAFNVQFDQGRAIFIDTLSFERLRAGQPWVAYRQFCQHFLAPLALMAYVDVRFGQWWRLNIDGVPLSLASRLLPRRTWLRPSLLMHLHLHALAQTRYSDHRGRREPRDMSLTQHRGLVDHLRSTVERLRWRGGETEWGDYYSATNYDDEATQSKLACVDRMIADVRPAQVWDLGGNDGRYSRLATARHIPTICFDIDPTAVDRNYRESLAREDRCMLPLICDLTSPSPGLGWAHRERQSLLERGPTDLAMALALVHHLAISNNVPLDHVAQFFARLCRHLIIEFVPKEDTQVRRLLATREDVFPNYHQQGLKQAFEPWFDVLARQSIANSSRTLYLMKRRSLPSH